MVLSKGLGKGGTCTPINVSFLIKFLKQLYHFISGLSRSLSYHLSIPKDIFHPIEYHRVKGNRVAELNIGLSVGLIYTLG